MKFVVGDLQETLPGEFNYSMLIAWMGELRNAYKILVGNPEGKRPLVRIILR
jgi:hypothetical protein